MSCPNRRPFVFVLPFAFLISALPCADAAEVSPVMRNTNDRDADLIDAMIAAGLYDEAEKICVDELKRLQAPSDDHARWTIRQSEVLAGRMLTSDDFDDASIRSACMPIRNLTERYPDHPRSVFLRAAIFEIQWAAARHDVVIAAVRPSGNPREERALRRITKLSSEASELITRVDAVRNSGEVPFEDPTPQDRQQYIADLIRLQQEIQVLAVAIQLLQSELFSVGTRDYIAAATGAIEAADETIANLPVDCDARRQVEMIRVQAFLRSGDHRRARQWLDQRSTPSTDVLTRAIEVQIDLAAGDLASAKLHLDEFFGDSPADAPRSVEFDLARLAYLVEVGDANAGKWLDAIGERSGVYARRRAEAISLRQLRDGETESRVAPALIAAQGKDWLRRGDRNRAADLLSAAARAEADDDLAIQYAQQAAAVLATIHRTDEAAGLLSQTAVARRDAGLAATLQLQAALLHSKTSHRDAPQRVERSLRNLIKFWPKHEVAAKARTWLVTLLVRQDRLADAAEAGTPSLSEPGQADQVYQLWRNAYRAADGDSRTQLDERFLVAYASLIEVAPVTAAFRRAATLLVERRSLDRLPGPIRDATDEDQRFVEAVLTFRKTGNVTASLQKPGHLANDAKWRLMQDGLADRLRRKVTARLIDGWSSQQEGESADSPDRALRLLWMDDVDDAIAMLRRLVDQSTAPGDQMRRAAEMLGDSDHLEAQAAAVKLWDELSAGLRKGSRDWHEAKLNAITLLKRSGSAEEATKRSRYILLASPPDDEAVKRRYEAAAKTRPGS